MPELGTLCPSSKPAPGPGTSSTGPAAQLDRRPRHRLHSGAGDPWATLPGGLWGHVLGWGGRQAGSPAGAQQVSGLARGVRFFTSASPELWHPLGPFQPELGTWGQIAVGIGGAGARVGLGKEFGKRAGGRERGSLGKGACRVSGVVTLILTVLPPSTTGGFGKTEQAAKAWLEILQPTLLGTQSWRVEAGLRGESTTPGRAGPLLGLGAQGPGPWGGGSWRCLPAVCLPVSSPPPPPSSSSPAPVFADCGQT